MATRKLETDTNYPARKTNGDVRFLTKMKAEDWFGRVKKMAEAFLIWFFPILFLYD